MTITLWTYMQKLVDGMLSLFMKKATSLIRSVQIAHKVVRYFSSNKDKYKTNLDVVEKLNEKVYRVMGLNPGPHTLGGTNTYLIRAKNENNAHVLIDTGEGWSSGAYVDLLFNKVFPITETKSLKMIILTHGHEDHQGGVKAILKELTHRGMLPLPTIYKRVVPHGRYPLEDNIGVECLHITDTMIFPLDDDNNTEGSALYSGTTLQAVYTPGHTDDHVAFLLFNSSDPSNSEPTLCALFTGDCVLGCGTTVFDDLFDYMQSLTALQTLLEHHRNHGDAADVVIYPGHGPVVADGLAKVKEYIQHRTGRENQLLEVMRDEATKNVGGWSSSLALVEKVYGPSLSATLKLSAQANLTHHLNKLLREGKVRTCWPDLWKIHIQSSSGSGS